MKPRWILLVSIAITLATGCGRHSADSTAESDPPAPAPTADDNTWGNYLAEQGKTYGKDMPVRPYIFLVPDGDNPEAISRRKELTQYVASVIGPVILPGSMMIMGGRSPHETNAFARNMAASVPKDALKGVVVLIVSDGTDKDAISRSFTASQATIRFSSMRQK
jgi:uncharacterized lipoprotein YajG